MEEQKPDPMAELDRLLRTCFMCKRDKKDPTTTPCDLCKPPPDYPMEAPDGQVFVCHACGRLSKSLIGDGSTGWDESCMMNAVLCLEASVEVRGRMVIKATAVEGY